jgi:hypothetical protein
MFNLEDFFEKMAKILEKSTVFLKGIFMNADAVFDSEKIKQLLHKKINWIINTVFVLSIITN